MTVLRRGDRLDINFMRSLLVYAYNWHVNVFDTADIPIGRYIEGWGRAGDTALIAMDGGHPVGAGWFRLFRASLPGYGFVDENTPELTVVVVPTRQGEGIGQQLLTALLDRAQSAGYDAVSVSVERNHPEVALYDERGFEQVAETDRSVTMLRKLGAE